jgi:predicted nucleic-acid-binding protein
MRAVDTNVVIRLVARDDPAQVAAAEAFVATGCWVSHVVLVGAAWVLGSVYDLGRTEIGRALHMLLEEEHFTVQEPDVAAAAVALFRGGGGRDFADCMNIEVARKAGHLPVGTFDRGLARVKGTQRL